MNLPSATQSNAILGAWNSLDAAAAAQEVLPCCGSRAWAVALANLRPYRDALALMESSDAVWWQLAPTDWDEAFSTHPRIGDKKIPHAATAKSGDWSSQEQGRVATADDKVLERLKQANVAYEQRFGRTYIVCATGKTAEEMLAILEQRLGNADATELRETAEQQRQITQLRIKKWLQL